MTRDLEYEEKKRYHTEVKSKMRSYKHQIGLLKQSFNVIYLVNWIFLLANILINFLNKGYG